MKKSLSLIIVLLMCVVLIVPSVSAGEQMSQAKAIDVKGDVTFLKSGAADWQSLKTDMVLGEGDAIKTGKYSEAKLSLFGTAKTGEVTVRENSQFMLKTLRNDPASKTDETLLDIEIGNILIKAEKLVGDSKFEVKTPTSIVGIRGTTFEVNVSQP